MADVAERLVAILEARGAEAASARPGGDLGGPRCRGGQRAALWRSWRSTVLRRPARGLVVILEAPPSREPPELSFFDGPLEQKRTARR